MFHLKFLFAALAIFEIAASLPANEKIDPVHLASQCIVFGEDNSKSPLLLLHGTGGSNKVWDPLKLLLAFRTRRKVCAVDLRNHGDSPWNNRSDVAAFTVDIDHFLDKEGIKKVNIIGQSLGGKIAIHYALNYPDRVDSIIVEDISPNTLPQGAVSFIVTFFQILKAALQSIPEGTEEEAAKKSIVNFVNKKLEEAGSNERLADQFSEFIEIKLVGGKWQFKFNIDLFEEGFKNLEKLWTKSEGVYEGPVLFIYGTKSPFKVYEDKENILKLFPKAELLPVEGAGHIIHGVFKEYDDTVVRFLNKVN